MSNCSVCAKKAYANELEAGADLPTHKTCFKCSVCSVRLNLKTYKRVVAVLYCQQHVPQQNFVEKGTAIKPPSTPTASPTSAPPTLVKGSSGTNVRAPSPGPAPVVKPTTTTTTPAVAVKPTTTTTAPAPTVKSTPAPVPTPASNTKVTTPVAKVESKPVPKVEPKVEPKPVPKPAEPEPEPEPEESFAPPPPPPVLPAGFFDDVDTKTLKRIEDLTARLESKAGGAASGSNKKETLDAAIARLSAIVSRIEAVSARGPVSGGSSGGSSSNAAAVADFAVYVDDVVKPFLAISDKIGDDVQKLGGLVLAAINAEKDLIEKASKSKKPSQADLQNLLGPLSGAINEVTNFREKNRKSKQGNHLAAVSEGIGAFGWVAVAPTPVPYVKDMVPGAQFYTNKILVEFKGKDQNQVDWANGFIKIMNELAEYVKKHHTTGLVWSG